MIICKTVEEFIDNIVNNDKTFFELTFENEEQYKELYEYCINKQNNSNCLLIIGHMHECGKYVEKDIKKAVEWYEKSLQLGNSNVMYFLACCYENEYFLEIKENEKIEELAEEIVAGIIDENFEEIRKKLEAFRKHFYEKAFELFLKSAELGNVAAMRKLIFYYEFGNIYIDDWNKNYKLAFYWCEKAAELGDAEAMFKLAKYYRYEQYAHEVDVEINIEIVFRLYKKSAELCNDEAMYELAACYEYGIGCDQDIVLAFEWYKRAAEAGNIDSMEKLANRYEHGIGCEQDIGLAFEWYSVFISRKYYDSVDGRFVVLRYSENLVRCYKKGKSIKGFEEKVFTTFKSIAESDYGVYIYYYALGLLYEYGIGCEKNTELAFKWYNKPVEFGFDITLFEVARCYEMGIGCNQNRDLANKCLNRAFKSMQPKVIVNIIKENHIELANEKMDNIIYYTRLAAEKGFPSQMRLLASYYEEGIYINKDLKLALYWYKQALENGNEFAREDVERIENLLEEEKQKQSKLVFGTRKDTFISWNHLDKDIKDDICTNLEKRNLLTVWESDGNGVGNIDENIKNAILSSRSYIVILTGNSIKSSWVEKEISLILSKIDNTIEYENVIRPIIINRITDKNTNQNLEFDVVKAINELEDKNPFKKLLNYCASFEDFETGFNYDQISSFLYQAIGNSLKIEYKTASLKKYERFSSALNTVVSSRNTKTGIIAATLEFESGYLNRYVYDENNNKVKANELLNYNTPSLIYGEGGTGKSLYLKNFIRNEFKNDKYIFYLECRNIVDPEKDFITNLKEHAFDTYFRKDESEQLTLISFEQLFNHHNKIIILIDALDEISLDKRTTLIEKLYIFYHKYKNVKLIFTTRSKQDSNLINTKFHLEIHTYQLKGLETIDIEKLYDNLSSKYQIKDTEIEQDTEEDINKKEEFDPVSYKESFFEKLKDISEDIKKNPLLISNLIFIYFATHKIPDTSFDIINESVLILINDLEEERNSTFDYMDYIANDNINKILGYLALQRSYNNTNPAEVIIKEYLAENYENIDHSKIADAIYKYLRRRAIIVNENISHEIFKNYFASSYIFLNIYDKKYNIAKKKYYAFKEQGLEFLDSLCQDDFQEEIETWNNIAIDLLYKLDFEIFYLDSKKEMNEKHLSYEVFNTTLIKTLTEEGYNKTTINIIKNILDKVSFHYNEFIKRYIK